MRLSVSTAVLALALASCLGAGKWLRPSAEQKEAYLAAHPETTPEVAEAIRNSKWVIGMTEAELLASLNHPYSSQHHTTAGMVYETWEYRNISFSTHFFHFENGILKSWSEL